MLTKLAKVLGLRHSNGSSAEHDLAVLALKGKCAGDNYYHHVDQSTFKPSLSITLMIGILGSHRSSLKQDAKRDA
ncbi:hypothetical protein ACTJJ7_23780 [Phyllobacterium sp. 22229]|uniref:hypothetical protein n=1 Tax=Phyllobacterium sp. 22229 TaxID=3453895 RepID=UPI003F87D8B5